MITRINRTQEDIKYLINRKGILPEYPKKHDYAGWVVKKPWGYEYLAYENRYVSGWVLKINGNNRTSMHCHLNKKTSILVLRGEVVCSTLDNSIVCRELEGVILEQGVFHSTKSITGEGAMLLEFESPPNKLDLIRLKDDFGREGKEYEGLAHMSREFHKYEYIDLQVRSGKYPKKAGFSGCRLTVDKHERISSIHQKLKKGKARVICLLSGDLHDQKGKTVLAPGELMEKHILDRYSQLVTCQPVIYLMADKI